MPLVPPELMVVELWARDVAHPQMSPFQELSLPIFGPFHPHSLLLSPLERELLSVLLLASPQDQDQENQGKLFLQPICPKAVGSGTWTDSGYSNGI